VSNSETDPTSQPSRFFSLNTKLVGIETIMLSKSSLKKAHKTGRHGQAIVEFAIVLPILMVLLVGILEVGRMLFMYAAVSNASREAVRFGSAVGFDDDGFHKYRHCAGIKAMAQRSAFFVSAANLTVDIRYDKGPNDPVYADGHGPDNSTEWNLLTRCDLASGEDTDVSLDDDVRYRVLVSVAAPYRPMVTLIPISARTFTSSSARTIIGYVSLDDGSSSVSGPSGGGGGGAAAAAAASVCAPACGGCAAAGCWPVGGAVPSLASSAASLAP